MTLRFQAKPTQRLAALLLAVLAGFLPRSEANSLEEYRIKAAYLLNFLRFTQWPDSAGDKGALVIGVLGADPFGDLLDQTVSGKTVRGRPISVRRFRSIHDAEGCWLLFFGANEASRLRLDFERLPNSSILTVGDTDNFVETGGAVGFVTADNKVRFDVNLDAVSAAHLRLDAQLLSVARKVKGASR